MKKINFSKNWNQKLYCNAFTTIRIASKKYEVGDELDVYLKTEYMGIAKVLKIVPKKFSELTEFVSYTDAGTDLNGFKKILTEMYKIKDGENPTFNILLLKWHKKDKPTSLTY